MVNTHFHFDHADGNPVLAEEGAWIVAQRNARRMMTGTHDIDLVGSVVRQPPYPPEGLPVLTYEDTMRFHLNGQQIDVLHFGPAHTTGDTAVIFRGSNAVHMGDVFNNTGYPFIDAGNGGTIDGFIEFGSAILAEIDEETTVIPGHGQIAGYQDLADFVAMLKVVRARIAAMIDSGMSLDDVKAAQPTADFDDRYGDAARFLDRAYFSLSRRLAD